MKPYSFLSGPLALALSLFTGLIAPALADPPSAPNHPPTCAECAAGRKLLGAQLLSQKSDQSLLDRNRAYLANLSASDASKSIKVKSNILILMVRLEALKNNIEGGTATAKSQACQECARK